MLCSRGGDPMLARIGVLKALHRGIAREFNSDRKETHWGKRKLKRINERRLEAVNRIESEAQSLALIRSAPETCNLRASV